MLSAPAASAQASDPRGNPSSETRANSQGDGQAVTLAYDGHGRLTSYARSGEAALTHSYNGLDDRIATTTTPAGGASDTRRFIYVPDGRVLGEYGSSASDIRAEFIWMAPEVGANDNSLFGGDDGLAGPDLYYNRYRDYDPSTGRYIQADPIGLDGGASPCTIGMVKII